MDVKDLKARMDDLETKFEQAKEAAARFEQLKQGELANMAAYSAQFKLLQELTEEPKKKPKPKQT